MSKTKEELLQELAELESLEQQVESKKSQSTGTAYVVGKSYFIRTVTYHLTGKIKSIIGDELVLADAAWIADSGRFSQAINTGTLDEVEPVDVEVIVNKQSIVDAYEWKHTLPRKQK